MPKTLDRQSVLVAGTHILSDAYPNVRYRINALKQHPLLQVTELNISSSTRLDYSSTDSRLLALLMMTLDQLQKSTRCVFGIVRNRYMDTLYVPYPAVPVLFLLSCMPRKWLPKRIVADVFISLYDTVVIDRQLLAKDSLLARLLRRIERRALRSATVAMTDTPENSTYLASLLDLPDSLFEDLPLSINEACFNELDSSSRPKISDTPVFKLLFVGTLVPLHRLDLILEALMLLTSERIVEVTFIGDGQQSNLLETFLHNEDYDTTTVQIKWVRDWQSSKQIRRYVQDADACLGIMGHQSKSGRVWPFKNYLYMASGKALITADTVASSRLRDLVDYTPFITVDVTDPKHLAECLTHCAQDPGFPGELGANARRFFNDELSLMATHDRLYALVSDKAGRQCVTNCQSDDKNTVND